MVRFLRRGQGRRALPPAPLALDAEKDRQGVEKAWQGGLDPERGVDFVRQAVGEFGWHAAFHGRVLLRWGGRKFAVEQVEYGVELANEDDVGGDGVLDVSMKSGGDGWWYGAVQGKEERVPVFASAQLGERDVFQDGEHGRAPFRAGQVGLGPR